MARLEAHGIRHRFGSRPVLSGLDLVVGPGEIVGLSGPNGAGKSTLLRCAAGLLLPDAGRLRVDGAAPPRARRYGWIGLAAGGEHRFERRLSLAANLRHQARIIGLSRGERDARIAALSRELGFAEHLDTVAERCSTGLRARADLARALLAAPRLLLLDEPLRSVDATGRRNLMRRLREGLGDAACVWVSHDGAELAGVADRVLRLDAGRLQPVPRWVRAA